MKAVFLRASRNLISGLPDQDKVLDSPLEFLHPGIKINVLVIPASNQENRSRHRAKCLNRRIDIGSLGVIVVTNPRALSNKFDTMLYRFEFLTNLDDLLHRNAHLHPDSHRTHHIFIIVLSQKM